MPNEPTTTLADLNGLTDPLGPEIALSSQPSAPLPVPQWCKDHAALPGEPPLGINVNALPDMTTANGAPRPAPPRQLRRPWWRR